MRKSRVFLLSTIVLAAVGAQCPKPASWQAPLSFPSVYPQDGQTFQKNEGGGGEIIVSGDYGGVFPVEARWLGGAWTIVDPSPAGGRFSGALSVGSFGRGLLEIRAQDGAVLYAINNVGVGDIYALEGQSNAVMLGETPRISITGAFTLPVKVAPGAVSLFKQANDSLWRYDPPATYGHGSIWPLLADKITLATGIPVGFVAVAEGATTLVHPQAQWAQGSFLWNRMINNIHVATADEGCVRAILSQRGEGDAANGVSYNVYKEAIFDFAAGMQSELSCPTPLVVGQVGHYHQDNEPPEAYIERESRLQAVRSAQIDAASEDEVILPGPYTADLPTIIGGHFGDGAIPELAARWCESLEIFYGGTGSLNCRDE